MTHQGKHIVNFHSVKSKSSQLSKTLMRLGQELGNQYFMLSKQSMDYFVTGNVPEGQQIFLEFLKDEHNIIATPFRFKDGSVVYAYGYVIEDSEGLTGALLKYGSSQQ